MITSKKLNLILIFLFLFLFLFFKNSAFAYPFSIVDRMDINSADLYDFMDLPEIDFLRAEKLVERRKKIGEYNKIEDLTSIISPDLFNIISDTIEVGSFKGPRDEMISGNSFSDLKWDMNRNSSYTMSGRYNMYLSNRIFTRISYSRGSSENKLNFKEVFLEYYTWSDGFFPKNMVTVPRPEAEVRKRIVEGTDAMEKRVLSDFDSRYGHELLIGRKRKKKIYGLFDTDLNSYQKYFVTKKKKRRKKRRRKPKNIKKFKKEKIVFPTDKKLLPYHMKIDESKEKTENKKKKNVMTGIWSFGNVSIPQSPHPLIDFHRTKFQGIKYKRILDDFRVSTLYEESEDNKFELIGGNAYAYFNNKNGIVGVKAHRLYHKESENDINSFSVYGMGDIKDEKSGNNTHIYGEYQTVFDGASSIYGLITSNFGDLYITTKILSVKENYGGPKHVEPLSFDGLLSSTLRLTYNFSGISAISAQFNKSDHKKDNPDVDAGSTKQAWFRLFVKPTEKALFSLGYTKDWTLTDSENDTFFGRLRYRYSPRLNFFLTTSFTDHDVNMGGGHTGFSSVDFRFRVRKNLKVNLEFINKWDEDKAGTDAENESMGRINYYYNF